ncbi:MAG: hypothetical protein J6Q05_02145 [Elusimicrobiaceae bacterium]|nr:hypothetical protein [Elusimicrobiaceae bacterium]
MKKFSAILCMLFCFSLTAQAEMSVVRIDGNKIYLDTSEEKAALTKGTTFKVIVSSEKLTNPKTGKELGKIYKYSAIGTITEVQPLYAVGELKNTTGVSVGKTAVLEEIKAALPVAETTQEIPVSTRAKTIYQPIEQTVISLTEADITAAGSKNIITLNEKNEITVFSRATKNTLKEEMRFTLPKGKKGITISAFPVKAGLAQIFVAVYNQERGQISTLVLENNNGQLENIATFPYFIKELGCGSTKKIWGHRPFILGTNPGNAHEIVYEKQKFVASGATFNTRHNFLEGLNYYPVEKAGQNNLITTASDGTLRILLDSGKRAESKDYFGSTPLRLQYKQEFFKFYPSEQDYAEPGQATLAAVENTTKLGLLSETFGSYQNGKIHFLDYNKGRLRVTDTVTLDGVLYDTACTDTAILTAEALPNGTSTVVEILK